TCELMSPIFFNYDPRETSPLIDEARAPFIWYTLRQSFQEYLTDKGLNRPLSEEYSRDFTPHFYELRLTRLAFETPPPDWPEIYGTAAVTEVTKGARLYFKNDFSVSMSNAQTLKNMQDIPGFETLSAVVLATPDQVKDLAAVKLRLDFFN